MHEATEATAEIDGDALTQPQAGILKGVTPSGISYAGGYRGVWTGIRIRSR